MASPLLIPVAAIWAAAGEPEPPSCGPATREGVCALTGTIGPVWSVQDVASTNFGAWETMPWVDMSDPVIGAAGAWALRVWGPIRSTDSRWKDTSILGTIVDTEGHTTDIRAGDPFPPVPDIGAVIVPLTRQKHVVLGARWGCWSTDHGTVYVGSDEVDSVAALVTLRAAGVGEAEIGEPLPRPQLVAKTGLALGELLDLWSRSDRVRVGQPHILAAIVRLTRRRDR